jgi:HK97 family phage portal protein
VSLNIPGWLQSLNRSGRIATASDAYEVVPMLYRAVNLRCDAISTVPYTLTRRGETVDWPWRQSVSELIRATERSMLLTGGAYWYKVTRGRTMTGFVVLNPTTMVVGFEPTAATLEDPYSGALFTQSQMGKVYGPWTINEIVYFREPSYRDDIRPGLAPAAVALQSAQLGHYLERFTSAFFEGGAQPVMVMNLPEAMDDAEFARFRGDFSQRVNGVANAFRSLFVRTQEIKVQKITPDINTMMLPELQERVITSIAMTMGVPRTMLEASAANYATADSDRQSFWRETVVPRLGLYEQVLNNQLLGPIGYEIRFEPEKLDVMQADEADRADSLLKLTQAGVALPDAMRILGYDNVDEMFLTPTVEAPLAELPEEATQPAADIIAEPALLPDTKAMRQEHWGLLAKKLERRIKAGKVLKCTFESDVLTADEIAEVMARIEDGMTVHDVQHVVAEVKAVDDLTDDERRIYNRIVGPMEKRGTTWARQIMQGKDPDASMADIIGPVMNDELARITNARIDRLGNQFAYPMDDYGDRTLDWLNEYTPALNRELDSTSRSILSKVIEQYRITEGMTIKDVEAALRPAVGRARASAIAITEVTRAASHATIEYQTYLGQRGIRMERIWNTDADELVCPVCVPLNNQGEDEWLQEFPLGPPAHVRCRCDTTLKLVKE